MAMVHLKDQSVKTQEQLEKNSPLSSLFNSLSLPSFRDVYLNDPLSEALWTRIYREREEKRKLKAVIDVDPANTPEEVIKQQMEIFKMTANINSRHMNDMRLPQLSAQNLNNQAPKPSSGLDAIYQLAAKHLLSFLHSNSDDKPKT